MGFIDKLYDEGIYISEDFGGNKSYEFKQEMAELRDLEAEFYKGLTQEQIKFYEEEIMSKRLSIGSIEQKRMYEYAFRLACSIVKDCLLGGDTYDFQL